MQKSKSKKFDSEPTIKELLERTSAFDQGFNDEFEAGIDEAGRGPVLGPMVYAIAVWRTVDRPILSTLGFADSKQLTEEERDGLFEVLERLKERVLTFEITSLSPMYLSNHMLMKEKHNLNQISHDTAIDLVYKILNKNSEKK